MIRFHYSGGSSNRDRLGETRGLIQLHQETPALRD